MISNISVLNTVQDNALDVFVDADGFLNVTGCPKVKATDPKVNTIVGDSATVGITTVTFTAVNNYTYNFRVTGYDSSNNLITLPFSYTTAATGSTATTIATAVAAMISKSAIGAQFASVAGGATLVLTGTSLNPLISFDNYTGDTSIVISAVGSGTTIGKEAIGYGADLLVAYGGFIGSSAIIPTALYNQYEITVNPPVMFGGQAITEVGSTTYVVLINRALIADSSVASGNLNPSSLNFNLLASDDNLGVAKTMGTITGLARGYRVVIRTSGTSTALITVTSGAIALTNVATSPANLDFSTLSARQGDVVLISATGGTAFTTSVRSTLIGLTSATAATGDNIVATPATAQVFKLISLRNIPN
jgi:hypothetical protein